MKPPLPSFSTLLFSTLILFTPLAGAAAETEIAPGDDMKTVLERLGTPQGSIGSDRFQILYYDRGEIQLRDGIVEVADLISAEEVAKQKEEREIRHWAMEVERQERIEEGKRLLDTKLSDPSFTNASPDQRLAFFNTFKKNYPEVDISTQRGLALSQIEAREQQRRFAEAREWERSVMEFRQREREAQNARAEREAAVRAEREAASRARAERDALARLAQFHRNRNLLPGQPPPTDGDADETPQAKPLPPGINAAYTRGGRTIHYRSDYTNNRAYITNP